VHETPDDRRALAALLDGSYARAGAHLRSIFTPELRVHADELVELMPGMQLLALATVTARCEPRVAPVDGLFFRGQLWFGSSPDSVRFSHLRARPQVSATHIRGEELAVVAHGVATRIDVAAPEHRDFADHCVEVYGEQWRDWGDGAAYARIDATTMFASRLPGSA
jgi:hypothetical protein